MTEEPDSPKRGCLLGCIGLGLVAIAIVAVAFCAVTTRNLDEAALAGEYQGGWPTFYREKLLLDADGTYEQSLTLEVANPTLQLSAGDVVPKNVGRWTFRDDTVFLHDYLILGPPWPREKDGLMRTVKVVRVRRRWAEISLQFDSAAYVQLRRQRESNIMLEGRRTPHLRRVAGRYTSRSCGQLSTTGILSLNSVALPPIWSQPKWSHTISGWKAIFAIRSTCHTRAVFWL